MQTQLAALFLISLTFGFLLFGGFDSRSGGSATLISSNKVFAPSLPHDGGQVFFSWRPMRPTYRPLGDLDFRGSFRWNFFDP